MFWGTKKLAGPEDTRTTEFDLRVGDMTSYRGAAVKILQLLHPSKYGFAKAMVRTVTHDSDSIDTVNYADLTPLGDIRPELLVPRDIDMSVGRLVFFEDDDRGLSGNIIDVDGVELQVHATVQANKKEHRFVPLYTNSKGDKVPREKPHAKFAPCVQCVNQSQVLATAPIEKFLVPKSALSSLRSRGVFVSPITVHSDDAHTRPEPESTVDTISAGSPRVEMLQALDEMQLAHIAEVTPQRYLHQQEAAVFPLISSLSRRHSIGEPGGACCRTCRDGTPCAANFHTRPFPGTDSPAALPQAQAAPYPQDTPCCSPQVWANATVTCHSKPSSTCHTTLTKQKAMAICMTTLANSHRPMHSMTSWCPSHS